MINAIHESRTIREREESKFGNAYRDLRVACEQRQPSSDLLYTKKARDHWEKLLKATNKSFHHQFLQVLETNYLKNKEECVILLGQLCLARVVLLFEEMLLWNLRLNNNSFQVEELGYVFQSFQDLASKLEFSINSGDINPLIGAVVANTQGSQQSTLHSTLDSLIDKNCHRGIFEGSKAVPRIGLITGTFDGMHYGHILDMLRALIISKASCCIYAPGGGVMREADNSFHKPNATPSLIRHQEDEKLTLIFWPFIRYSPILLETKKGDPRGEFIDYCLIDLIRLNNPFVDSFTLIIGRDVYRTHFLGRYEEICREMDDLLLSKPLHIDVCLIDCQPDVLTISQIQEIWNVFDRLNQLPKSLHSAFIKYYYLCTPRRLASTQIRNGRSHASIPFILHRFQPNLEI